MGTQNVKPSAEQLETLRLGLRGELLLPDEAGYEAARQIWNGMIERRPAAIVRCRGAADIIAAVTTARQQGWSLSVRGGGHNVAGKALSHGGLTLDLSLMNQVRVDPAARRAWAGGGATWADFDHEAQAFGLTCTGGVVSSTGVAGLTLGGGIGYLTRSFGLACDNLVGADVVTADGALLHTSATEHADLFWALRGGGGNFGVVASLEFALHPVGPRVAAAIVFHDIGTASDVLRQYRAYNADAPDSVACYAMVVNAPPDLPAAIQGKPVLAVVAVHAGDLEEGERQLAPLADMGNPLAATVDTMPYTVMQTAFDAGNPSGSRYYWKSQHLTGLSDELIDTVAAFGRDLHGSLTIIGIEPLGGAMSRVEPGATAFPHRDAPYSFGIWTGWTDPADDATNVAWTRAFYDAVQPFRGGAYLNYLGEDEGGRVDEALGSNLERLRAVKQRWDPQNLFASDPLLKQSD